MTARERVDTVLSGGTVRPHASLVWSASPGHQSDIVTCELREIAHARSTHPDQLLLVEIYNPYGRAIRSGCDINAVLEESPSKGDAVLAQHVAEAEEDIREALANGADGIFYRLDGAYAGACTPMQYGGHFLELDRALLDGVPAGSVRLLHIMGETEIFLDFVADLPAEFVNWDQAHQTVSLATARALCKGKLALDHVDADLFFARSYDEIARLNKRAQKITH
ncbi:MAG: hypothetical protein JNM85_07365 [Chthonomonas sp.]|nr:hypothetical protein [Chthonomonas sp.]